MWLIYIYSQKAEYKPTHLLLGSLFLKDALHWIFYKRKIRLIIVACINLYKWHLCQPPQKRYWYSQPDALVTVVGGRFQPCKADWRISFLKLIIGETSSWGPFQNTAFIALKFSSCENGRRGGWGGGAKKEAWNCPSSLCCPFPNSLRTFPCQLRRCPELC